MSSDKPFDFWYAVNNTEVLLLPKNRLEAFGATIIDYHLVCELMDYPDRVRVREGRIEAHRPEIITPQTFMQAPLEGFEDEASSDYMAWLNQNKDDLLILKYGFQIRKRETQQFLITESLETVVDRIRIEIAAKNSPFAALLVGVDEPWEVCLLKLMVDLVQYAAPQHVQTLHMDPTGDRHHIEHAFRSASRDKSLIPVLSDSLQKAHLFKDYEDRFYALVRSHQR